MRKIERRFTKVLALTLAIMLTLTIVPQNASTVYGALINDSGEQDICFEY